MNTTDRNTDDADPDPDPDRPDPTPGGGLEVEVSDTQSHLKVDPGALARLVREALAAEGVTRASVSVAVVDDATIRAVNRRHLGHDWATDVISFGGLSDPGEPGLCGELVVSAETAVAAARRAGVDAGDELALYVVHGLLHLCGYDDSAADDRDAMRRRESALLAGSGRTNTFPAAGADGGARERER